MTHPNPFKIRLEANDLSRSERVVLWNELVKVMENMKFAKKIVLIEWNIHDTTELVGGKGA